MSISEFALHNVLRTYSRQERIGQVSRARLPATAGPPRTSDQVSLSPVGQKVAVLGQLAAEVVDRRHPELAGEDRSDRVRATMDELLARHRGEVGNAALSPQALEATLRPLYLG